jgi:hypothetical protein
LIAADAAIKAPFRRKASRRGARLAQIVRAETDLVRTKRRGLGVSGAINRGFDCRQDDLLLPKPFRNAILAANSPKSP